MKTKPVFQSVAGTAPKLFAILVAGAILTGCENLEGFTFLNPGEETAEDASADGRATKLIERDVEAPDVFSDLLRQLIHLSVIPVWRIQGTPAPIWRQAGQ